MAQKLTILGMNARNLRFLRPYNRRRAIRIADDKLLSKRILEQHDIPTQKLFAVITRARDLKGFRWHKMPTSFVIKPNRGFGGGGIVVIKHRKKKEKNKDPVYVGADGSEWTIAKLEAHILDILDGRYSLTNSPDLAFIEERISLHHVFDEVTFGGVPDIRVIVFNRVPVMAMLRLPTKFSKGTANIAKGGLAVGLDLATGVATNAVTKKPRRKIISKHPDTGADLLAIKIPFWEEILEIAIRSSMASGLRMIGVDIALDRKRGPVVMELNARPGLEIQVANLAPLGSRLERVEGITINENTRAIRLAKDLFGGDIERRVEDLSHKHVLGVVEAINVVNKTGKRTKVFAKVDTGAGVSSIDVDLAYKLGFKTIGDILKEFGFGQVVTPKKARELSRTLRSQILNKYREVVGTVLVHSSHGSTFRLLIPITYYLAGVKVSTRATVVERESLDYPMIIGRRDLGNFLIDPTKKKDASVRTATRTPSSPKTPPKSKPKLAKKSVSRSRPTDRS